ncbi:MBG domain, YGX type [Burkholderiaceae bacterium]
MSKVYGQTPDLTGFSTSALVNGETVGSVTQTSAGQVANAGVLGNPYVVTPSNATGGTFAPGNYTISYVNGALTVTPAPLTITAQDVSKVYGQTPALTSFTSSPLANGETVGTVTQTSAGQVATANVSGNPYTVTPSNATGGTFAPANYTISYVNGALTVTPISVGPVPINPPDVDPVPDPDNTPPHKALPEFSAAQGLPKMPRSPVKPVLLDVWPLAAIVQGPITFPLAEMPLPLPEATPALVTTLPELPVQKLPVLAPKQDRN